MLTLLGLAAAGFCYNPKQQKYIFREIEKVWTGYNKYSRQNINNQINSLYKSKLIKRNYNKNGSITVILTNKGKIKALTYKLSEMNLQKGDWDKKWRVVFFDIPEKQRAHRDIFRDNLKKIGFYELQKSVFIFPYECENEIEFLIEFYNIRKWARFAVLEKIDDDVYLKKAFAL